MCLFSVAGYKRTDVFLRTIFRKHIKREKVFIICCRNVFFMSYNLNTYFFSVYERFFLYKWLVLLSNASVISLHKREAIWLLFFYVSFGMRLPLPLRIVLPYRKSFYCFGRGCRCDVCDIILLTSNEWIFHFLFLPFRCFMLLFILLLPDGCDLRKGSL